ncbi:MAG: serine/threonine-protein kinase [Gemmataceae bacterium]
MLDLTDHDELLEQFEQAWLQGPPPALADFLPSKAGKRPPDAAARRSVLMELVKIDLEYRWRSPELKANPRPSGISLPFLPLLEDYVKRFPEMGTVQALPIELIGEEYRVRQRWGDRPKHGDYSDRFPRHSRLFILLARIDAELQSEPPHKEGRRGRAARTVDGTVSQSRSSELRCPHCRQSIEMSPDFLPRDMACPACGGAFSVESLSIHSGRHAAPPYARLGRYELQDLLGTGGFGSVWRAQDTELGRDVAVKLPRSGQFLGPAEEERFLREARSAARLQHPGIVAVHDVGRDRETLYIVSELIQGVSLAEWLLHNRMSFQEAADLVARVADALDFAHQRGVVHRDIKPSNIMLEALADGEPVGASTGTSNEKPPTGKRMPRITDFGLALGNASDVTMTLDGQILGTPAYISPEQIRNPHGVDGRSDQYSVGVILYELLTGELPFRGMTRMLLDQVISDEPRPPRRLNDKIPRDLETICLKCLAKEPDRRYRTAGMLAADLRCWLAGKPIRARPVGWGGRLWLWIRRNPALAVAGAVSAAALIAVTGKPTTFALWTLVAATMGSLFFALYKARAAAELALTIEDAKQQQLKTAAALQFTLQQCLQGREERDRAVAVASMANRRFGSVQGLARSLIFDLPAKIENAATPAAARSFLVESALAYLRSLAKDSLGEPLLLREVALAYAKVGDWQATSTASIPADSAGALASYRRSRDLFAALVEKHRNNPQARRDLAVSQERVHNLERLLTQSVEASSGLPFSDR